MKLRVFAALAALTLAATATATPASAQSGRHLTPTLTVTGEAGITRAPDRATVAFRIETTDDQAAAATSANAAIAAAVHAKLVPLGIPASAISTADYGLSYTPHPAKPDPSSTQRYGYTVQQTINVIVDRIEQAGAVVDAGVAAGVTGVDGVSFSLRDGRAAQRTAQAAALADAVAQARALAAAAKVRLVRILAISPSGGGIQPPTPRLMMAAAVPTAIEPGDLTVRASVTVSYEIAPG